MKERLDVLLISNGYAESREKAKAIIMSGQVFVDGQREDKAGSMFDPNKVQIEVKGSVLKYVSRGGLKLEKAMAQFALSLQDKVCMDIGMEASQRSPGSLHGKDQLPLCYHGANWGAFGFCVL